MGQPFAAGLIGTGGPAYFGPECNPYTMRVTSGSLPPGLQFGEPDCEWIISGTPAQAGTYSFTVQITPQPNSLGQIPGPSGTQQLTIGSGTSDRLANVAAGFNGHLRAGVAMLWCGGVMLAVCVMTGLAHAPRLVPWVFLALGPFCALVGFIFVGVGVTKGKREIRQVRDEAIAKAQAAAQARRSRS